MSILVQPGILRVIYQLTRGQLPETPLSIDSFDDAITCLVSNDREKRNDALQYLRNMRGHVLWGSLSPYLVFYYHTLIINRDIEAATELRTLISNSIQNVDSPPSFLDRELYHVLSWSHSIIQSGLTEEEIKKISLPPLTFGYGGSLVQLVAQLILVQMGGVADLRPPIQKLRQDMLPIPIEEEVSETYHVPVGNNLFQTIESYFLFWAETIAEKVAGQSYLVKRKKEIEESIKKQTEGIVENKYYRAMLVICFSILLVYSGISQVPGISSPLKGQLGFLALFLSLILLLTSGPIERLPRLTLRLIAYLWTVGKRLDLFFVEKELARQRS